MSHGSLLNENYAPTRVTSGWKSTGWDVSNLFTIVPLRASASDILTEQTLGRGLRLPYGKRTGVAVVDQLTVVGQQAAVETLPADRRDHVERLRHANAP